LQALPQSIAQRAQSLRCGRKRLLRQTASRAETDDIWHVLCSRSSSSLVAGPVQAWLQLDSTPDIQDPDAFRCVELVAGDRQQIDAQLVDVNADLAHRLSGVGVQEDAAFLAQPGNL